MKFQIPELYYIILDIICFAIFDTKIKDFERYKWIFCFRQVLFDLAVEGEPFIEGLDSLEKAIASFFHVCFVANMQYPKVELANIVVICSLFFGALLDLFSAADPDPKYFTHKNGLIDDN